MILAARVCPRTHQICYHIPYSRLFWWALKFANFNVANMCTSLHTIMCVIMRIALARLA